jgi:hypothetical protein
MNQHPNQVGYARRGSYAGQEGDQVHLDLKLRQAGLNRDSPCLCLLSEIYSYLAGLLGDLVSVLWLKNAGGVKSGLGKHPAYLTVGEDSLLIESPVFPVRTIETATRT